MYTFYTLKKHCSWFCIVCIDYAACFVQILSEYDDDVFFFLLFFFFAFLLYKFVYNQSYQFGQLSQLWQVN